MASLWSWLMERLEAISDLGQIHHGLMLPILLYCSDPFGPLLGPTTPRGSGAGEFLRTAYHDFPLVLPEIRDYWSRSASRRTIDTPDPT